MARPKGSKNKKKVSTGANLDDLIAQRLEEKAVLEAERDEIAAVVAENAAKLRAVKYQIKKLDKQVAAYEAEKAAIAAAAEAAAAKEAVQAKVDELMASGKSLDEIMGMLG